MTKPTTRSVARFLHSDFMRSQLPRMRTNKPAEMREITNPDFIAALLYEEWNDYSTRRLDLNGTQPICVIEFIRDSHGRDVCVSAYRIPVAAASIEQLLNRHWIRGTAAWGFTDMKLLKLSDYGKTQVASFIFPRTKAARTRATQAA